ncbi:unnamed protein product [Peronospora belbahrii]|uniref:Uncharacterized protein n=1 Tax=Peronospora belbahrii TaxID=622444 RepID=A0ABN8CJS2_9STRA|nr:unnamed protein product [Peronospora belbahrii]
MIFADDHFDERLRGQAKGLKVVLEERELWEAEVPAYADIGGQRFLTPIEAVDQGNPYTSTSDKQRLPIYPEAVEQGFPRTQTSVEQWYPITTEAIEQELPYTTSKAVDYGLPPLIDKNARTVGPYVTYMVVTGPTSLARGMSFSSDSDVLASSNSSRCKE